MARTLKLLGQTYIALLLLAVGTGSAMAAPVTYNYVITGTVLLGDEIFDPNVWGLTAGDVITASGTFTTEDLGPAGLETGTVLFGGGDTMTIDLLGGQFLTVADALGAIELTFAASALTDFDYISADFNSSFTFFDDYDNLLGQWTGVSIVAVPVPAAVWLFGSGLLAMAGWARRKPAV